MAGYTLGAAENTNVTALTGTEEFVCKQTTAKDCTSSVISEYVIGNLLDATSQTSIQASDEFLIERSDSSGKIDIQYITSYILGSAFDSSDGSACASGDLFAFERSGTIYTLDIDDIKTYCQTSQSTSLDLSGLTSATLDASDYLLIGEGATPTKTTLGDLETQLWTDFDSYLTALDSVSALASSDAFYVLDNGTPQKILASTIATYVSSEKASTILATAYDNDAVTTLTSGDVFILESSDVPKTATINKISDYVQSDIYGTSNTDTAFAATDEILLERSNAIYKIDVDYLTDYTTTTTFDNTTNVAVVTTLVTADKLLLGRSGAAKQITYENFASGIKSTVLDISGLSEATLSKTSGDQYLVVQSGTPKYTDYTEIAADIHEDILSYTTALSSASTLTGSEELWMNQSSTAVKATPAQIATYVESSLSTNLIADVFDGSSVSPIASGDLVAIERTGVLKSADVDEFADYSIATLGGKDTVESITAGDEFALYRSGTAYLGDIDDISSYIIDATFDSTLITSALSGDLLVIERSGDSKTIDIDDLKTYVSGITSLSVSDLSTATLTSTDELLVCQSTAPLKTTLSSLETKLWSDFATYANGLGTPMGGLDDSHAFYILSSGTPKKITGSTLNSYTTDAVWDVSAATSLNDTDVLLIKQGSSYLSTTISDLSTDILDAAQSTILDISGLTTAVISDSDYMLFVQGSTAKQATVSDLIDDVYDELSTYVDALTEVSTTSATDKLYCIQGGVEKELAASTFAEYCYDYSVTQFEGLSQKTSPVSADVVLVQDSENSNALKRVELSDIAGLSVSGSNWTELSTSVYTTTPASTSTITMSDTSDVAVGLPLKYTYGGTAYYGIVTAVTTDTSITIAGATLDTLSPLTGLSVGKSHQVRQEEFFIEWIYADAVQDCLASVMERNYKWQLADAYLVSFSAVNHWVDSGATQPYVNVKIGGNLVSTNSTNNGIQLSATEDTWTDNSAVAINTSNYKIERSDAVEIRCTAVGTNGDAEGLTVSCIFVFEE